MKVCYTAGIWDLLHLGHLNILKRSKELAGPGGTLIVGVITDGGAAAYKRRPVQDERTRAEVVKALRFVDAVVMQHGTDPSDILKLIRPDMMTHGSDWDRLKVGHETLERLGIDWVVLPYTLGVSTTETIARMTA